MRGVSAIPVGSRVMYAQEAESAKVGVSQTHIFACGQTDTCENITFANFVCGL